MDQGESERARCVMLVSAVCEMYLVDREGRVRPNTMEGYRSAILCHVVPDLGDLEVTDLTVHRLQEWVSDIPSRGAAERAYKTLRQVIRWAIRFLGVEMPDPTQVGVELPMGVREPPRTMGRTDMMVMLRGVEGQPWEACVALAVLCGLRRCEACGLMWEDVDRDTGETRILRGRHYVGGRVVTLPPKTARSAGVVYVPDFWMGRMRALHQGTGWLCDRSPAWVAQSFKKYCLRNGLPWVPMTNLRHSWATQAIERGVPLTDVMIYLRHTNLDMSYDHYVARTDPMARRIALAYEEDGFD